MPRVATTSNIRNPKRYGYDLQLDNIYLRTAVGPDRAMTIQSSDVQAGQQVNVKQNPEDLTRVTSTSTLHFQLRLRLHSSINNATTTSH